MKPELIIALDHMDPESAVQFARRLGGQCSYWKVGMELFGRGGPAVVEELQRIGFDVFLDLKFHDIPATVAGAVKSAAALGVTMVNVHVQGGDAMMRAAAEAKGSTGTLVLGVTVLTSESAAPEAVVERATRAHEAGLDGVVCAVGEVRAIKKACGGSFLAVTPGIRPAGVESHDQARVATPRDAVEAGSDAIVVGRAVTGADDPERALAQIIDEVNESRNV